MNLTKLILLILAFLGIGLYQQIFSQDFNIGLRFNSHDKIKEQRTSLNLTPNEALAFGDHMSLKFDMKIEKLRFGYVLRIICDDDYSVDLLLNPPHPSKKNIMLVLKDSTTALQFNFSDLNLNPNDWIEYELKINTANRELLFSLSDSTYSIPFNHTPRSAEIVFGANSIEGFLTRDVPNMTIKNVQLSNGTEDFLWKLGKHNIDHCLDEINQMPAIVQNGDWLINGHVNWKLENTIHADQTTQVAYDKRKGNAYIVDQNMVIQLTRDGNIIESKTRGGSSYNTVNNQLAYLPSLNILMQFDNQLKIIKTMDFDKLTWSDSVTLTGLPSHWRANTVYGSELNKLLVFGGYGFHTFHNDLFEYDTSGFIRSLNLENIAPRYLAAASLSSDSKKLLIYSGYGSNSGRQELSPQSFRDLISVDLNSYKTELIWTGDPEDIDYGYSNSLVANEDYIYVLKYPITVNRSFAKIERLSPSSRKVVAYPDSIPYFFQDTESFIDFYLDSLSNKLIALVKHRENNEFMVNKYSLNYPPLTLYETRQANATRVKGSLLLNVFLGLLFISILSTVVLVHRKYRLKKGLVQVKYTSLDSPIILQNNDSQRPKIHIQTLGGFTIFDRNYQNITAKFSAVLKELFTIILLHTIRNEIGVSPEKINEILWSDKTTASARNNRNVNIKKLREILKELGDVRIESNGSYLYLVLNHQILCDYKIITELLSKEGTLSSEELSMAVAVAEHGKLLPNIEEEWLDDFKADYSNKAIDLLTKFINQLNLNKDSAMIIRITDAILKLDSLNTEALAIKCQILSKTGKHSLSKAAFDHFTKEYELLYAESFDYSFEEILKYKVN